ncbi:MAG: insulinase family protein [Flavobacteriales bacterium]|jgi:predicted Zn-dependent peptidase|nr:insulinase family protein [Flavobacteriales bacterium]
MIRKLFAITILTFLSIIPVFAQANLFESQEKNYQAHIPFKRYELPNGLSVIIHENSAFGNLVQVGVHFHAGTSSDPANLKGIAQQTFESMKQGSKNFNKREIESTLLQVGGKSHHYQTKDYTSFNSFVPSQALENILQIEADRWKNAQSKLAKKPIENTSYLPKDFYPKNHPYFSEPNKRLYAESEIKKHKARWFGANNAVITIVGNVSYQQALGWVEYYFSELPKGTPYFKRNQIPMRYIEDQIFITSSKNKYQSFTVLAPTEDQASEDALALEGLAYVLVDYAKSDLKNRVLDKGFAFELEVKSEIDELAGVFGITFKVSKNRSLKVLEPMFKASIMSFQQYGTSLEALEVFKKNHGLDLLKNKESIPSISKALAEGYLFYKNPNHLQERYEKLQHIRPSQIDNAAEKYLRKVLFHVDYGINTKENWSGVSRFRKPKALKVYNANGNYKKDWKIESSKIDKTTAIQLPEIENEFKYPLYHKKWKNGAKIIGSTNRASQVNRIDILIPAGKKFEQENNFGASEILAKMIAGGSISLDRIDYENILQTVGAKLEISSDFHFIRFRLVCPEKATQTAIETLLHLLIQPHLTEKKLIDLKQVVHSADVLDINSLKQFHRQYFGTDGMIVAYTGRLPFKAYAKAFRGLEKWNEKNTLLTKVDQDIPAKLALKKETHALETSLSILRQNQIICPKTFAKYLQVNGLGYQDWKVEARENDLVFTKLSKPSNKTLDKNVEVFKNLFNQKHLATDSVLINAVKNQQAFDFITLDEKLSQLSKYGMLNWKTKHYKNWKKTLAKAKVAEIAEVYQKNMRPERMNWTISLPFFDLNELEKIKKNYQNTFPAFKTIKIPKTPRKHKVKTPFEMGKYGKKHYPVFKGKSFDIAYKKAKKKLKGTQYRTFIYKGKIYKL